MATNPSDGEGTPDAGSYLYNNRLASQRGGWKGEDRDGTLE